MEENRQIMRALATAMNRIDQMYCDDVTRIGVKASDKIFESSKKARF